MKTISRSQLRTCVLVLALSLPAFSAEPEVSAPRPLGPGDHDRKLTVDGRKRSYLVHVPPGYDASKAIPVVLVLHGAATNGRITVQFTGMNAKSDQAGFIAVYPNGTGAGELILTWNAGGLPEAFSNGRPDDVAFIRAVLDDLAGSLNVDPRRIHAAGMSNGGMMCYKLAADLADRIASIAAVTGTMTFSNPKPSRPISVIHFHGTADTIVPFNGPSGNSPRGMGFKSVEETIRAWREVNGCPSEPIVKNEPDSADDGTTVTRKTYGPGKDGAEVVLIEIKNGGHTWPGRKPMVAFLGKSTFDVSANDLMWDFFQKHPLGAKKN